MTDDMIDAIGEGLIDRTGGWCFRIEQDADGCDPDRPSAQAFGVLIVDSHGHVLTVECRIADDGTAQVTARKHVDGELRDPEVFALPGAVMVTT